MKPEVRVTEIKRAETGEFVLERPGVDLGGRFSPDARRLENQINPLMDLLKARADRLFVLEWSGGRVPRGANLSGHEIAQTQHGMVVSTENKHFAYYDRLVDGGGEDQRDQMMLVYTKPPEQIRDY